ncbi:ABC transporter permease [Arthrobacter russicus]|jgi:spermidine/putrescine transport system permease protein|uniref:ABC-type spermidine/putrescine transport system permease subunit II n=1 Tax=Arthrobacter russicus TaxID=172040 RepID=A0ABU1JBP9_9MICC|nr:ABC transporter permease [Arthrobacter russicus]MDR6268832.1 ABC-type spermidine/putrescine transport system permease subunit II [Arthrobacter russicus]
MKRRTDPLTVLLGVLGILVFAFLFLPIVVILVYSFNNGTLLAAWRGFGFDAYSAAAGNSVIRGAVLTSLTAAAGSALLATVLGTLGGIALARSSLAQSKSVKFWAIGLTVLLGLTMVTPEIVDAVSLLPWFVSLGTDLGITPLNNGLVRLVIAHSVVSIAIVTFIVRARMQGVDQSLEEAAEDLYASRWHAFWQVTFPIAAPGILAGALMSFTISLDNTIVSSFVQVPGTTPWPVYIFSSLKVGLKPEVAAVSAVMFLLTLLALAFVAIVLRRTGGSTKEIAATMTGG